MLQFLADLPGAAVPPPVTLELFSPTRDGQALRLAEGAAVIAVSGDAEAGGLADGIVLHGLNVPATVRFIYDPQQGADPESLRLYFFDPVQEVRVELGGEVDRSANSITVQVDDLTTFAAMVPLTDAPALDQPPVRWERLGCGTCQRF
mgnify:CR=1 FL=1